MVLFWLYLILLFTFFYPQNSYFSETTYCRLLKPFPLDSVCPETRKRDFQTVSMHFSYSPFFTPKTLISQKLLIVDTWNHSHWIWHAPKLEHGAFKQFRCIFPTQNQENVNRVKLGLVQKENFCFNWTLMIWKAWNWEHLGFGVCQI